MTAPQSKHGDSPLARTYAPALASGRRANPDAEETALRSKIEYAKRAYDWAVVIISRGVGSLIVAGLFLVKKLTLPPAEFASLGLAYASVLAVVGAAIAPLTMLMARRVIQSRRIETDRTIIQLLSAAVVVTASFSVVAVLSGSRPSELAFILSVAAVVLVAGLNAQYIIWLNETGARRRSVAFILACLLVIPLSLLMRRSLHIGASDRTFGLEALLLVMPIVVDTLTRRRSSPAGDQPLYHLSLGNYAKYAVFVAIFNAIPATDWWFGRHLLDAASFRSWADVRVLFERGLLPVMNVVQATVLWRLLRTSIGQAGSRTPIAKEATRWVFLSVAAVFLLTLVLWAAPPLPRYADVLPIFVGYAAYGLTSIFLDFYQAKYTLGRLAASLLAIFVLRSVATYGGLALGGAHLFSIIWAATSLAMFTYVFVHARDQISLR
jgi:hypothetical protein